MKSTLVTRLLALAVAVTAVACSEGNSTPLGPREPSAPSLTASSTSPSVTKVHVRAVLWKRPLRQAASATALIGPEGGVLELWQTGLRVVVPAGAVSQPTQFGVTAKPGRMVAYDFSPHGTTFARPLRLEQDQSQIERPAGAPGHSPVLQLGYFLGDADLDQSNGAANVTELNDQISDFPAVGFTFPVYHFSGYIVSWGRW